MRSNTFCPIHASSKLIITIAVAAVAALATEAAWAAAIIWGPAQNISSDTDVSLDDQLLGALNAGQGTALTINGVTFSADPGGTGVISAGSATFQFTNIGNSAG